MPRLWPPYRGRNFQLHHAPSLCCPRWIDHTPNPNTETYVHWGVSVPDGTPEPNNMYPPESCASANYSESYDGAWGWADLGCYNNVSIMCKIKRGWQPDELLGVAVGVLGATASP
jgi:hypothetical protein